MRTIYQGIGDDGAFIEKYDHRPYYTILPAGTGGAIELSEKEMHDLYLILTNKFAQVGSDA